MDSELTRELQGLVNEHCCRCVVVDSRARGSVLLEERDVDTFCVMNQGVSAKTSTTLNAAWGESFSKEIRVCFSTEKSCDLASVVLGRPIA